MRFSILRLLILTAFVAAWLCFGRLTPWALSFTNYPGDINNIHPFEQWFLGPLWMFLGCVAVSLFILLVLDPPTRK
jgi:hypothetical protein